MLSAYHPMLARRDRYQRQKVFASFFKKKLFLP